MSRSGYSDDCEYLGLYRGAVDRAISGKRGQKFLTELLAALDAMPVKELVAGEIVRDSEHVCALGSVAIARGLDVSSLDVGDGDAVGARFGIAWSLANECGSRNETPAQRWQRMRAWVDAARVKS